METLLTFALVLVGFASATAVGNAREFSYTLETHAGAEQIWKLWTDVPNWKDWDSGLQSSQMDMPWALGAKGQLVSDKGRKVKFTVVKFEEGQRYAFRMKLPLGNMTVKRELEDEGGVTRFSHIVTFGGLTGGIFARLLGRDYQDMLPGVLAKIKELAEGKTAKP